jgi:hypothetical protein
MKIAVNDSAGSIHNVGTAELILWIDLHLSQASVMYESTLSSTCISTSFLDQSINLMLTYVGKEVDVAVA